jgi:hypothetical protein
MKDEDKIKLIDAAADWWLGKQAIPNPSISDRQNRDFSTELGELMMLQSTLEGQSRKKADPEVAKGSAEAFKKSLVEIVMNNFNAKRGKTVILTTDYGPEMELANAVSSSGVDARNFPNKSVMWINFEKGLVTARQGHRDDIQVYALNS